MRLLLDTHAIIWFYQTDPQLSGKALAAIQDPQNEVLVSAASYWEIAIKSSRYKSAFQVPFDVLIQEAVLDNGFTIVPIEPEHAIVVASLPNHHKDPFDRMLVAQSLVEKVPLVSADATLDAYGVQRFW